MKRLVLIGLVLANAFALTGCSDGKVDNKQPKIDGPVDPKIKGPAALTPPPGSGTTPAPQNKGTKGANPGAAVD